MNKSEKKPLIFFFIFYFILMALVVCPLSPMDDDWVYFTAPNPCFTVSDLTPAENFWRPLDALWGKLMSFFPNLFPALNRIAILAAHIFSAVLLYCLLKKFNMASAACWFAMIVFLFSNGAPAVISQPDALNQAYSLFWGILGLFLQINLGHFISIPFLILALLSKESGISWLFVLPAVELLYNINILPHKDKRKEYFKHFIVSGVVSFALLALYFAVRFALKGEVALGTGSGNYEIGFNIIKLFKNLVIIIGSSLTGIDSLALLAPDKIISLAAVTAMLSLPFLVFIIFMTFRDLKKSHGAFTAVMLWLCVLAFALPHIILKHPSEMHAYPVSFGAAFLTAYFFDSAKLSFKSFACIAICMCVSLGITNIHKYYALYQYSEKTESIVEQLHELCPDSPGRILSVSIGHEPGYSVYDQSGITGAGHGRCLRKFNSWARLSVEGKKFEEESQAIAYIAARRHEFDHTFLIRGDQVELYK